MNAISSASPCHVTATKTSDPETRWLLPVVCWTMTPEDRAITPYPQPWIIWPPNGALMPATDPHLLAGWTMVLAAGDVGAGSGW